MALDLRHPAICGAAQHVQRVEDPREAISPIRMMETALRAAADDAGAPKLLEHLDTIYVPQGLWKYGNPARMLGEAVGSPSAESGWGVVSGHIVQVIIDHACREIAAGRKDVVAIVGGESENSIRRAAKQGIELDWPRETPGEPDIRFGDGEFSFHEIEMEMGLLSPSLIFALCDTARRHKLGETPDEHRVRISELASRMSEVASRNPHAWIQRHVSAEEIRTPTPDNRWVAYPYTKLMTSNIAVDQSAALILCSHEAAERHGIARDKRIFLRAATEMSHVVNLSHRIDVADNPGQRIAAQRALEISGLELDDLEHIDLYSCFPFAVQAGAEAIGASEDRPLTVTGGLTFSGGPFGNYVLQAHARMVELLRAAPGKLGMCGSVGGSFAKFAFGAYSSEPDDDALPHIEDVGAEYAKLPTRVCNEKYRGPATVESYVVDMPAGKPYRGIFSTLNAAGERVWAKSEDVAVLEPLVAGEDACGRDAVVNDGAIELH